MKMHKAMFLIALTLAVVLAGSIAQANLITGKLWHVSEAVSQNAIPANVPLTTPDVTFDVNAVNFDSQTSGYSVGAFLTGGGAFNITENTSGTLASFLDPVLIEFSGHVSVTTGMSFTVAHDDGLTLIINGTNLGFNPGPSAPATTTLNWGGPSGTFDFQLVYGECCGPPAVLKTSLPLNNVPEPGMMLLIGSGLLGLAALRTKFKK